MPAASWQETSQRRTLIRMAGTTSQLADAVLLSEDFSTDTPAKLARLTKHTADLLCNNISAAPPSDYDQIYHFLKLILSFLRFVERARVTQTPWSLIPAAEAFLQTQVGCHRHFIIRPTWAYNYSILEDLWAFYRGTLSLWSWFPLGKLREHLKENISPGGGLKEWGDDEEIRCISFPLVEKKNCLLHANWGHEVGHILASTWVKGNFSALWKQEEDHIFQRIRDEVLKDFAQMEGTLWWPMLEKKMYQKLQKVHDIAKRGTEELLCDIIGVHLFGLSAVGSASEIAAMQTLDATPLIGRHYPPWRYRLRRMMEYCASDLERLDNENPFSGYWDHLLKWLLEVRELTSSDIDIQVLRQSIETREAYQLIEDHWAMMIKGTLELLPEGSAIPYSSREKGEILGALVGRLELGIPPNETGYLTEQKISLQDILLSAWAYKYYALANKIDWGTQDDYSCLYRLVLKAIESHHVAGKYKKIMET
jgi:hypothetical protein